MAAPSKMKACGFGGPTAERKDILAMTAAGFGSVQRQFTANNAESAGEG